MIKWLAHHSNSCAAAQVLQQTSKQVLSPKHPGELWMHVAEVHHCCPTNPLTICTLGSHRIYPAHLGIKQRAPDTLFFLSEATPCSELPITACKGARSRASLTTFPKSSLCYVWKEEFQVLIKKSLVLLPLIHLAHSKSIFFLAGFSP